VDETVNEAARNPSSTMPLTAIEPRRLYRQIAEQIRGLIASGEYGVGDRLPPERDLAKQLRVSRPSVREALIALEVEGLVEVRVGSGIYVLASASINGHNAVNGHAHTSGPFELIRARRAIEGECAAIAAKEGKRAQLDEIGKALERMEEDARNHARTPFAAREAKPAHPLDADREFHLRIAEATNNAALTQVVKTPAVSLHHAASAFRRAGAATWGWIRSRRPGAERARQGKTSQPEPRRPRRRYHTNRHGRRCQPAGGVARLGGPMPQDQGATLRSRSKALFAAPCPSHANGQSPAGSAQREATGAQSWHFRRPPHGPQGSPRLTAALAALPRAVNTPLD